MTSHNQDLDVIVDEIRGAFPDIPPDPEQLFDAHFREKDRPFEYRELREILQGKRWSDLSRQEIEEHPDWLVYLSPDSFVYYLPAWLVYTLNYLDAEYPAQFILEYLNQLDAGTIQRLTPSQRRVIQSVFLFLRRTYPSESFPPIPPYVNLIPPGG